MTPRRGGSLAAVVAMILGVVVLGQARPASACTCAYTQAETIERADAVFTGSVVDGASGPDATSGRLLFEVDEVFKGRVHERQWVDTGYENSTCSTSFEHGVPYVVIARGVIPVVNNVVVAPVTSTVRRIPTCIPVGLEEGLDHDSVATFDNLAAVPKSVLTVRLGALGVDGHRQICQALGALGVDGHRQICQALGAVADC